MYILDFASMILRNFETLNHVGGVITSTDEERLKGFLKMMQETVQVRKKYFSRLGLSSYSAYRESGQTELPQIVIFLDNWVAFRGYYPDYEDQIISISRESVAAGISFVVTAGQAGGAGFKLLSNFSKRTALYCNDSSDYAWSLRHAAGSCMISREEDLLRQIKCITRYSIIWLLQQKKSLRRLRL